MLFFYKMDYRVLKDQSLWILLVSLVLLLLVFVPGIERPINRHHRWIGLLGFTFQPSELAKLALIVYMARMLTDQHDRLKSLKQGVLPALGLTAIVVLFIIVEPDIGAGVVTMAIIFLMWFIGGMRILHLAGLVGAAIPPFAIALMCYPDRLKRIAAFILIWLGKADPSSEAATGKGFQLLQSLIAVGSGGLTGRGLGNSMQKHFLTEQFSDFIFAIISEELGFIGAVLIILCFFFLIWEGWRVALRAPDFFAVLLASGITLMLAISVALNLMVVTGMAPTKGLALPLLSYGGSSMVITMASIGILMNIGKYVEWQRALARSPRRARLSEETPSARRGRDAPRRSWFRRRRSF
jgi:cell division protein FtsW